ncbi:MAG: hypothetical protein PHV82_03060 [Victivallaceae bacterium]|nr:hypothetical protein [Victivallaceae bacterium]
MSKISNLLRAFLWETPRRNANSTGTAKEKQRIDELEVGILKFCGGVKLLDNAFQNDELVQLRLDLFNLVQNSPPPENPAVYIDDLESEIDLAIACLKRTKPDIHSKQVETLRLYLIALRQGNPNPPVIDRLELNTVE